MTDLTSLIRRALKFREEAEKIISSQKPKLIQPRVITEESLYNRLPKLNLKQDDLLRQAIRCVENDIYRGAHVYAWAAMADYIQEQLAEDGFQKLNQARTNWNITSIEQLRETKSDYQTIEAFKVCGFCGRRMEHALKGFLNTRNECAHPSDYYPDREMTLGYLHQILERFRMLEARKSN